MAYRLKRSSSNWASLPRDLAYSILDKLAFHFQCYIRFSIICKSWNSFTVNHYKENCNRLTNQQLPWLLVSSTTDTSCRNKLYNFTTSQFCSFRLRVPFDRYVRCYATSHGWLFFVESFALVVLNPLSGIIFHLPPLNTTKFHHLRMVTLSMDPSLGSFEVLISDQNVVAYLNYGDEFWSYSEPYSFQDFIFYKNGMFGVSEVGEVLSLDVMKSSQSIKPNRIASTSTLEDSYNIARYLVETTNGELITVHRYYGDDNEALTYKVFKLIHSCDSIEQLQIIPIKNLDGDSLFFGNENHGISVVATNYPGCIPNSIYYRGFIDNDVINMQFEVFNMENGSVLPCSLPENYVKSCLTSWIAPTIKL